MGRIDADAGAYLLQTARAGRILSAGHARRQVVRDDDRDVAALVYGVQQSRHARMGEGRVADDGDRRIYARVGGSFGHRDRSAHIDAGVDGVERGQPAQRITAYVAEYLGVSVFVRNLLQSRVDVPVAAALTKGRRTRHDDLAGRVRGVRRESQCGAHAVGRKLSGAGQLARHAAANIERCGQDTAHGLLDDGLSLFDDEQRTALRRHAAYE